MRGPHVRLTHGTGDITREKAGRVIDQCEVIRRGRASMAAVCVTPETVWKRGD